METRNIVQVAEDLLRETEEKKEAISAFDFKMVTFSLCDKDYAIDIMHIKEIAKAGKFTYVPNTLPFVLGVYNLRGEIIPILDLRIFFNIDVPKRDENKLENLLILNYNLFNYSLRSALFGEFFYTGGEGFAVLCIVFAYAFCIILAIALVKCLLVFIKYKKGESQVNKGGSIIDFKDFIFLFLLVQSQVLPEMFFYVKMPYACTMDFRYIMPIIPAIAIITGVSMKVLKEEGSAFAINLNKALTLSIIALFTCTTLFYCVAG